MTRWVHLLEEGCRSLLRRHDEAFSPPARGRMGEPPQRRHDFAGAYRSTAKGKSRAGVSRLSKYMAGNWLLTFKYTHETRVHVTAL